MSRYIFTYAGPAYSLCIVTIGNKADPGLQQLHVGQSQTQFKEGNSICQNQLNLFQKLYTYLIKALFFKRVQ